jgi:flagellar hook-associated protein 1 FlgK
MSTFSVGLTALNAAQVGVQTTSHNIANASTEGYTRQQIVQTTNTPLFTGAGYLGQGTSVETIQRIYNQYTDRQLMSAQTGVAEMDTYLAQIQQLDNMLGDTTAGLSPALSSFFKGMQDLSANPSSIPARQSALSGAQSLAARFQALNQRITEVRDGVNQQVTDEVSTINAMAVQLADINQRIILSTATGPNQPANDLLDQRDQLITQINKEIRTQTVQQSDGTFSVFIGNGQPLVVGAQASALRAVQDASDPRKTTLALKTTYGSTMKLDESLLTGGNLGGLLAFRSQSLDSAQNALGRIAISLGQTFNDIHKLGQDLSGTLGGDFFNIASPITYASTFNTSSAKVTATLTGTAASDLTASDYELTYKGGNYTLTRLSDNVSWTNAALSGLPPATAPQGFTLSISSLPADGDTFKIEPTRNGAQDMAVLVADPRNIAAAAPIRTSAALTNAGTAQIDSGSVTSTVNVPLAGDVTLTYNGTTNQFVVTGPLTAGPFTYVAGQPISFGGMTVTISGNPANNDKFQVGNNSAGVADNRNALRLGALQTGKTMDGGTASFAESYAQIVSLVGNKTREVQVAGTAQQALADQAQSARDQVSGVNLDEEAAKLLQYQQAYQAAAKMIDIAGKLFDQILALGN